MAKEVIVTAILIIASVVAVVAFVNAIIPSVYDLSHSYSSLANNMGDQFRTSVDIVFVYPEDNNVSVWIKNIGSENIPFEKLKYCDFFILSSSKIWNPTFESGSPSWNYTLVNGDGDNTWNSGETIKTSIYFDSLPSNSYQITFFLYNGVSASDEFSK
jgi:archaeal flagellar protein FlaG